MAVPTEQHQIIELVGLPVVFVQAWHITEGTEGYQMMYIMLAIRRFRHTTFATAIIIPSPHFSPLFLPVGAIIV